MRQWTLLRQLAAVRTNTIPNLAADLNVTTRTVRRDLAALQEQTFEPVPELDADPFKNSLGVHRGPATRVQLRFHPQIAASIKERTWHASQRFKDRVDGSVTMTLDVSDDYALRSWLLGFGRFVRVLAPSNLADWIQEELDQARQQYAGSDHARVADSDIQPGLPFLFNQLVNA